MSGAGWESVAESFVADLRYAGRTLRKSPVFTLVTVLVIALGSGAVTTIFSATNAMLLRPLPGTTDAGRLFSIDRKHKNGKEGMSASYGYYRLLRDNARLFDGVAAWNDIALTVSTGGEGTLAYGDIVSGNYFSVLGVRPELGRFFLADEDSTPLTHPVIVFSHAFWQSRFGGDSAVVGKTVSVNGHPYSVIGIAPAAFRGVYIPLKLDAWVPLMMQRQLWPGHDFSDPADNPLRLFARLKPGVSQAAAQQEASALTAARVASGVETMPWVKNYVDARLVPLTGLPEDATKAIVGFFFLLLGASALVLVIASVNVAAMLSARAVARRREMAVRAALGAKRGRLVRQLLTESLTLFVLGAVGGLAVALVATRALERLPLPQEVSLDLSPDYRVIAFALLVSLVTGVAFGLAPALQAARTDIARRIREDGPSAGVRRTVMGNVLVVGQLALSLLLLVAAGLFLRALERGNRVDPGFDSSGVSVAQFNTVAWGYDEAKGRAFYSALREQLEAVPGVAAVSFSGMIPLAMSSTGTIIHVNDAGAGAAADANDAGVHVRLATVGADYFGALKMPIVSGVPIGLKDAVNSAKIAVINQTAAATLWPDGSAVGRTFEYQNARVQVIGVARNAKYASLTESDQPFVFFPMEQYWQAQQVLLVRSSAASSQLAQQIQRAVRAVDPLLPRPVVTTLRQENGIVLLPQKIAAIVTGALGAIGLLMATVGLYGVISYSVNRRRREIGIRVALGARQSEVLGMIVREGMRLAAVGVVLGLVLAAAATRLMAGFLFSVSPLDAVTFAVMSLLFLAVALLSSYLPARRAAATDPMTSLRTD